MQKACGLLESLEQDTGQGQYQHVVRSTLPVSVNQVPVQCTRFTGVGNKHCSVFAVLPLVKVLWYFTKFQLSVQCIVGLL